MARENTLYVIAILKENSDKDHPLTASQIQEQIKTTYFSGHPEEAPNPSTISRSLDSLMSYVYEEYSDHELCDPLRLGFQIVCCVKNKDGSFRPFQKEDGNNKKSPKCYYYYKSLFDVSEISLLTSSLEAYNFFSAEDTAGLVSKLTSLSPRALSSYHGKNYENDTRADNRFSYTLENVATLQELIHNGQFAEITNGYYDVNHKLVQAREPQVIRPLKLLFNNGYYYLVASVHSKREDNYFTIHYRIDRICEINPYDPSPAEKASYPAMDPGDAATYRLHHPLMFGDELTHAEFQVKNTPFMLNALYDFFGNDARITPIQGNDKWLSVKIKNAAKGGIKLFATEYCSGVVLLKPDDLAQKVKSELTEGLSRY